ncbi:MAG: hypothetical protein JW744_00215 [Candidatus Diapherotrites archaeon]|uniref:50S ribosomal protein L32e n=1 Tax=Candidatus Iainarchaeum sp. TaxID=3101447 RepID=A0A939C6Q6_9ARCH|nr:hypothetical protein [Candidatus Diapherotrites archaeon]
MAAKKDEQKKVQKQAAAKKMGKKPAEGKKQAENRKTVEKAMEKKAAGMRAGEEGKNGVKKEIAQAKAEGKKKGKKEKSKARKGPSKSKQVKKLSRLVKRKKKRLFRGRFGKRNWIRNISKKKWQKWRRPRGIDIYFNKEDGLVPGTGYRTPKKIRFVHPSGFREKIVRNMNELEALKLEKETKAARIASGIGRKKRQAMLKKADEIGVFVLNR